MAHKPSYSRFRDASISSLKKMQKTYVQAMKKLKDATRPEVCLNRTSKSQGEDITKQ
jgi:hypothetical protein